MLQAAKKLLGIALSSSILLATCLEGVDAVWLGTGSTTDTNDLGLNTNWSNGILPTVGTGIATFNLQGTSSTLHATNGNFNPGKIVFDTLATSYVLDFDSGSSLTLNGS